VRRPVAVLGLLLVMTAVVGCDDDAASDDTVPATTEQTGADAGDPAVRNPLPIVDQIPAAIDALEAETGGAVEFFEINATAQFVNLFVALNDGAVAQPWLYAAGELTSSEGQPASGGTFSGDAVDVDPEVIFDRLLDEVPGITVQSFYIHGDGAGNLLYGVLASSEQGGGLDIVLAPNGDVVSVDPVT
jgi:hypothetical protein